jgi:hypothetical protein
LFDVQKFRTTKAQECSKFADAAMDVDDRVFWSRLAEQWSDLADGSKKGKRNAAASSALYRASENFTAATFVEGSPAWHCGGNSRRLFFKSCY